MNYIGSKYSLLDFLHDTIKEVTKFSDNQQYTFADLFAGTGVVGSFYRSLGCNVISNDIQYYSYVLNKHFIENDNTVDKNLLDHFNTLRGVEGFIFCCL